MSYALLVYLVLQCRQLEMCGQKQQNKSVSANGELTTFGVGTGGVGPFVVAVGTCGGGGGDRELTPCRTARDQSDN